MRGIKHAMLFFFCFVFLFHDDTAKFLQWLTLKNNSDSTALSV